MYYWVNDSMNREWEILIQGEYEAYPDGESVVTELEVVYYSLNNDKHSIDLVPQEIIDFAEMLMESPQTYIDMQRDYEGAVL